MALNNAMEKRCFYCKYPASGSIPLEKHHVFGRANSDLCVYACLNCHKEITEGQQKGIPKATRVRNASKEQRTIQAGISLAKHLSVIGREFDRIMKKIINGDE